MATAKVRTDPSLGFPHKGSLKRIPFPRLMREIARNQLTGSLYLLSRQTKKVVFFQEGHPVFVRSNVLRECLGQILAEEGLITQEQCEQTLEAIRRTGKKQGELLVEMGILSEGNLRYGLAAQLRAKLYDIFSWEDGRYQFKPGPAEQTFHIRLNMSAEGVIVEAIQDRYSEERALKSLQPYRDKYPLARERQGSEDGLNLLPEELHFLDCLHGHATVSAALESSPNPGVPTPGALLYGLLQAGVVQLSDREMPEREPPPAPDLSPPDVRDDVLAPGFEATRTVTEYEDTPLPGQLPSSPGLLGDHEADFDDVEDEVGSSISVSAARPEVSEELVAAEPESVDETFEEEEIELLDDDEMVEIIDDSGSDLTVAEEVSDPGSLVDDPFEGADDLELSDDDADLMLEQADVTIAGEGDGVVAGAESTTATHDDDLMSLDELDQVDLSLDDDAEPEPAQYSGPESTVPEDDNPEIVGAMHFNEGESALSGGDFAGAIRLLESAYDNGFDVAELHAMLAYARFMAGGEDPSTSKHSFELLDYAEDMDPSLDLVHAYRGAIHRSIGETKEARTALQRALELNPYCELAMQIMDSLG